ncbi:MAG: SpoIIE family protein phosphatase [Planctomycetes bacterium]|nr:SpoIIE family protein phosphatase [Planctomycetota bacterium]MBL7037454.1 SpoIIE family protein phosphatase [Pirellulaceae bacterium]
MTSATDSDIESAKSQDGFDQAAFEPGIAKYVCGLLVLWTIVVVASLAWSVHQQEQETLGTARAHAATAFEKDLSYRSWIAKHGGVYVWVNEETQSSVYLEKVSERDIDTPKGSLTLRNPAMVSRQVYDMERQRTGVHSHITSENPLRPENKADSWETEALHAFGRGAKEVTSIDHFDGKPHMRLMRPLLTEEGCLKCHETQGYKVGDVQGGIAVSVPMEPLYALARNHNRAVAVGHGLLWLVGAIGIVMAGRSLNTNVRERHYSERQLRDSETERQALAERNARLEAEYALRSTRVKLRLAARIQRTLLPKTEPTLPGFDIGAILRPSEETSGDFYDFLSLPDGSLGIVVGDVSGHGIDSAMIMAATSVHLRGLVASSSDLTAVLARLNRFLLEETPDGFFVTLFFAQIDPQDRSLSYASAGQLGYLLDSTGAGKRLDSTGTILGCLPDLTIPTEPPVTLQPGQTLLIPTDGFLEAASPDGDLFGEARILELIRTNDRLPSGETLELLYQAARRFSQDAPQRDDMTAVMLKA